MAKKAAKKSAKPRKTVWVFQNDWEDRHGESDSTVKTFSTREKAAKCLEADIRQYLEDFGAVCDGNIDLDCTVTRILADDIEETSGDFPVDQFVAAAVKGEWADIFIDDDTYSRWSIEEQKVD